MVSITSLGVNADLTALLGAAPAECQKTTNACDPTSDVVDHEPGWHSQRLNHPGRGAGDIVKGSDCTLAAASPERPSLD